MGGASSKNEIAVTNAKGNSAQDKGKDGKGADKKPDEKEKKNVSKNK